MRRSQAKPDQRPYSPTQLAERWEVDPLLVERLCRTGKLRSMRVGGAYRIKPEWVDEYERKNRSTTVA
jgi:excisionase family DNA binding protein